MTQTSCTDFLVIAPHSSESSFIGPLSVSMLLLVPFLENWISLRRALPTQPLSSSATFLSFPPHLPTPMNLLAASPWPSLLIFSASAPPLQQPFHSSATSVRLSTLHPALSWPNSCLWALLNLGFPRVPAPFPALDSPVPPSPPFSPLASSGRA